MRSAIAASIASLALLTAGCSPTIKTEAAVASVVDLVSKQTGFRPKDVKCPSDVEAKIGIEFECHFTGPEGSDYTAHMKVANVEGDEVQLSIDRLT